ncbi:hypothetical protein N7E70_004775 [Aminobacter sp. NyZ550]|jgi:hypothetical protein|uniref:ABC-type Fe3+-hydroxamate transport system substrate-binding protein n=2 Tax=Aminobacter TaxID=31988 RepID=A0AAC8YKP8_AMIAI|nr:MULTISPECIES: hypothetical protein [Aminobacter]AMS39938.1 hypothetical protein AA2016_1000 [Aminobacter aminovorans]MBA8906293.1 ABC-type Fe3+-hydroxamate transport system substrate-binding protein [Aminobacter ciceronei]MBA9020072.1 ABC-type Fe3+-hydroxamate transport system substrate-binding protein [Aminobacter ciceronei]MBB3707226.1 ABC-type Fe3+-hydroxamate transport system substrate-binding protein [Aminobacter aminovorans]MRX36203.1 hypothetical protein [Aminobacter sp. MDW-2]
MRPALALTTFASFMLAAGVALTSPAAAGGSHDRVYADSFGNLIVESTTGYKRIIVGEGASARKLAAYTGSTGPKVVYLDGPSAQRHCYRPPMLLKGRSYMYGFSEGEIPQPGLVCR